MFIVSYIYPAIVFPIFIVSYIYPAIVFPMFIVSYIYRAIVFPMFIVSYIYPAIVLPMFIVSFLFVIVCGLSVWKWISAGFLSFGYILCIYIGDPIIMRALNPINRSNSAISFVPVQNRDLDFQGLFKCCVCEGERCSFFLFYISRSGDRRCLSYLFINLSKIVW